jgi:hypothetical protein
MAGFELITEAQNNAYAWEFHPLNGVDSSRAQIGCRFAGEDGRQGLMIPQLLRD